MWVVRGLWLLQLCELEWECQWVGEMGVQSVVQWVGKSVVQWMVQWVGKRGVQWMVQWVGKTEGRNAAEMAIHDRWRSWDNDVQSVQSWGGQCDRESSKW